MDATRAEVSIELLELPGVLRSLHSSPFENVPVCTIATEPGLSAYVVSDPLRVQLPPGRPSV